MNWLTGNALNKRESCAKFQHIHLKRGDEIEQLKQIEGYERYQISPTGDVYDTKINKYICKWVDCTGYYQCYLKDNEGKKHSKRIHRLVANAYIPNNKNLPQVNHKDGNKLNNNVNNLEWISNRDNTQHGYDNNLYTFKSRSYPINVYLKPNHIFYKQFKSIRSMCEELPINRKTVTEILRGNKKNNYQYDFEYVEKSQETIESIV